MTLSTWGKTITPSSSYTHTHTQKHTSPPIIMTHQQINKHAVKKLHFISSSFFNSYNNDKLS